MSRLLIFLNLILLSVAIANEPMCSVSVTCNGAGTGSISNVDQQLCRAAKQKCAWKEGGSYPAQQDKCIGKATGAKISFESPCIPKTPSETQEILDEAPHQPVFLQGGDVWIQLRSARG